ncbi:MAG: acyltransferase [Aeromicrobium sp.]
MNTRVSSPPLTTPKSAALKSNLPALTGLRAVAALAVVATHAGFWTNKYGTSTSGLFWARLDFGVALFFALSGFLLFRPWVTALVEGRRMPRTGRYFWNRALRILPAYWVTVIVCFLALDSRTGTGPVGLLRHLSLTQIYGSNNLHIGLTQSWSLCTEISFYLALPLIGVFVTKVVCRGGWHPNRLVAVLLALCVANIGWLWYVNLHLEISLSSRLWLPAHISWFAVGMILAVLVADAGINEGIGRKFARYIEQSPGALWVGALACMALTCTPLAGEASLSPDTAATAITRHVLYAMAAFLIMATLVLGRANWTQRALGAKPVVWLGNISYELFLVHLILLEAAMNILGYHVFSGSVFYAFAVTLALSVPASWLLYRVLDAPLRRLHR